MNGGDWTRIAARLETSGTTGDAGNTRVFEPESRLGKPWKLG